MMPSMLSIQRESYSFWLAFRRALIDQRDTLVGCDIKSLDVEMPSPARTDITSDNSQALDDLIKNCLHFAALQWSHVYVDYVWKVFGTRHSGYGSPSAEERDEPNATKIERVVEVLEELIVSRDMSFCETFFEDILKDSQCKFVRKTIINLYTHLLPPLCELLSKLNQDITAPPFVDFLQKIIAMCLENLDVFILNPTTTSRVFRLGYYDRRRQEHLDSRITTARDICSSEKGRKSDEYSVKVTKNPKIIEASQWETRLQNAINFLALIGPDDVIAQIVGPTYRDVTQALSGENPFGSTSAKRTGSKTVRPRKRRKTQFLHIRTSFD